MVGNLFIISTKEDKKTIIKRAHISLLLLGIKVKIIALAKNLSFRYNEIEL